MSRVHPRASTLPALAVLILVLPASLAAQRAREVAAQSDRIELVRELVIGGDSVRDEYQFVGIGFAAATRSNVVFVSGGPDGSIRKYDALGRYRGDVGRPGSGPGEYRHLEGLAVIGDSLLVVLDRGNGRVVLFDTSGAYRRTFRVSGGGFLPMKTWAVFSDGTIGVRGRVLDTAGGGGGAVASAFIRYRLSGEILDTIRVPPDDRFDMVLVLRNLGARWPFSAITVFTLLPRGGVATAHTTRYRIDVAPARGPGFVIERAVPPVPLRGLEREEWQAILGAAGGRVPDGRVPTLPRVKPFIRDLFADAGGRIWVEVYAQAARRSVPPRAGAAQGPTLTMWEHNAYDVFDERGRFLGRVDLPPVSRLLDVRGDRAWVGEETEEGEILLVRYRLRMPPPR